MPPYGNDYKVYVRKSTAQLPATLRAELTAARAAYNQIADKTSKAAHDAAEKLCRIRNQLVGT